MPPLPPWFLLPCIVSTRKKSSVIVCACARLYSGHASNLKTFVHKMATKNEEDRCNDEWKQIEEEITCSICSELFKEPKTLPCLHTFCKECIQASLDATE